MALSFYVLVVFVIFNGEPVTASHVFSSQIECDRAALRARSQAGFEGISQIHATCIETPKVRSNDRET